MYLTNLDGSYTCYRYNTVFPMPYVEEVNKIIVIVHVIVILKDN